MYIYKLTFHYKKDFLFELKTNPYKQNKTTKKGALVRFIVDWL